MLVGQAAVRNLVPSHPLHGLPEAVNVLRFLKEATESSKLLWANAGPALANQGPGRLHGREEIVVMVVIPQKTEAWMLSKFLC